MAIDRSRVGLEVGRAASRRGNKRRTVRLLLLLGMVLVGAGTFLVVAAWVLLDPQQLRLRIDQILEPRLNAEYTIDNVRWSGFGSVTLEGVRIAGPEGSQFEDLVAIDELEIDLDISSVISGDGNPVHTLRISHPRIFVEEQDGEIPLFTLLEPTERQPGSPTDLPQVRVEQLEIHVCPTSLFRTSEPLRVDEFTLDLLEGRRYAFEGRGSHPIFGAIKLDGEGLGEKFDGRIGLSKVAIDEEFVAGFPPVVSDYLSRIEPFGVASTLVGFEFDGGKLTDWKAAFRLREGRLHVNNPRIEIEAIHGQVELTPRRRGTATERLIPERLSTVNPIRGLAWGGEAEIDGQVRFDVDENGAAIIDRNLTLKLNEVQLGERTREVLLLGGEAFDALADPSTVGRINLDLAWLGPAGRFQPRSVELDGVRSTSDALPFPVDSIDGKVIELAEDRYEVDLSVRSGTTTLDIVGAGGWSKGSPLNATLDLRNLSIDSELQSALGPVGDRIWDQWSPGGSIDVDLELSRAAGEDAIAGNAQMSLHDGTMRFFRFPLRIDSIESQANFAFTINEERDLVPTSLLIENCYGRNNASDILMKKGTVSWPDRDPPRMSLEIESPNLVADDEIFKALPDQVADTLRSLQFIGTLPTKVKIFHPEKERSTGPPTKLNVVVENRIGEPLVMKPDLFPYPMQIVQGETVFSLQEKTLELTGLQTDPDFGPIIEFNGTILLGRENLYDPKAIGPPPSAPYDLEVRIGPGSGGTGLNLDNDDFLDALPTSVRKILDAIEAKGSVVGLLDIHYWPGKKEDGSPLHHSEFDGKLRVTKGAMRVGVSLTEITTDFRLTGSGGNDEDRTLPVDFAIRIGSERINPSEWPRKGQFRFNSFNCRSVDTLVLFGRPLRNRESLIASRKGERTPSGELLFDPLFRSRLRPAQIDSTIQVHIPFGKVYGGNLRGLFFVDVSRDDFAGHFETTNLDLRIAASELFGSAGGRQGICNGEVLFSGNRADQKSLRGSGRFSIVEGDLGQLPLIQSIISDPTFLSFLTGDGITNRTIDRLHCRFDIKEDRFVIDNFSDFRFAGKNNDFVNARGFMTFDKHLELTLRASQGWIPEEIPVLNKSFEGTLEEFMSQ